MSETTTFALDEEASDLHLEMGLAVYRRLNARQRAAYAAELKRKVQIEIAEQRRPSRRQQKGVVSRLMKSIIRCSLVRED